jgi:hypothetical protein
MAKKPKLTLVSTAPFAADGPPPAPMRPLGKLGRCPSSHRAGKV